MNDFNNGSAAATADPDSTPITPELAQEVTYTPEGQKGINEPKLPYQSWFATLIKTASTLALLPLLPHYGFLVLATIFSYVSTFTSSTTNMFFPIEMGIANLLAIASIAYAIVTTWTSYKYVKNPYEYYGKLVGTAILLAILSFVLSFSGTMISLMLRT